MRNTSEDNIIVKKDIKKMDNINEKIKIVEKHGTDTEEVKKKKIYHQYQQNLNRSSQ